MGDFLMPFYNTEFKNSFCLIKIQLEKNPHFDFRVKYKAKKKG